VELPEQHTDLSDAEKALLDFLVDQALDSLLRP
jgi:hypothetical protein